MIDHLRTYTKSENQCKIRNNMLRLCYGVHIFNEKMIFKY